MTGKITQTPDPQTPGPAFGQAAVSLSVLRRLYDETAARQRAGEILSPEERAAQRSRLATLYAGSQLVLIQPDDATHADLRALLVTEEKKDKVHPLNDASDLSTYRLGGPDHNKRTYALTLPGVAGADGLLAVIYTCWSREPAAPEGAVSPPDLPGCVNDILREPSAPLAESPNTVIFYSISSFFPEAGARLIGKLHQELAGKGLTHSTLSPLRSLRGALEQDDLLTMALFDESNLWHAAIMHVMSNKDLVQKFHLGNGAYFGDIKMSANEPGTSDDIDGLGIMVNYVYPADPGLLDSNRVLYGAGLIPVSETLYDQLASGYRAQAVLVKPAASATGSPAPAPVP